MSNPISDITHSLKQIGDVQVNDWDFKGLMNKDISELEITRSLRKLGNRQVMKWDFKDALPAVQKLANQEVDLPGLVRRTARYKVMEWDLRSALHGDSTPAETKDEPEAPQDEVVDHEQMGRVIEQLKNFLQYVVINLIDEPGHAQIKVREISSGVLRFKVILVQKDVAMLIGRKGHTASAIRSMLKGAAGVQGLHALLDIRSHEEEAAEIWSKDSDS